ncbi:unnamed protein product [Allacma fusca]|uniref:Uncharacterized protein n=1 Tax=Allacma fusca TaxID=39272 RepID=A0A8J2KN30_9HEXA|nr:unnamed protein product [Allacma fusca]
MRVNSANVQRNVKLLGKLPAKPDLIADENWQTWDIEVKYQSTEKATQPKILSVTIRPRNPTQKSKSWRFQVYGSSSDEEEVVVPPKPRNLTPVYTNTDVTPDLEEDSDIFESSFEIHGECSGETFPSPTVLSAGGEDLKSELRMTQAVIQTPIVVGIYYGNEKPPVVEYFFNLVEELWKENWKQMVCHLMG